MHVKNRTKLYIAFILCHPEKKSQSLCKQKRKEYYFAHSFSPLRAKTCHMRYNNIICVRLSFATLSIMLTNAKGYLILHTAFIH